MRGIEGVGMREYGGVCGKGVRGGVARDGVVVVCKCGCVDER